MGERVRQMPPRGRYLAREVGRLAGVSGQAIGQWARRGYIRSSQSDSSPRVYSYQDAAEAMVVHALLEAHVDHKAIRGAIEFLRERGGADWPLTHAALSVPRDHAMHFEKGGRRKSTVILRADEGPLDTTTGHPVLDNVDLREIAADLRRGGWAARNLDLRHIEVDPDRLSGRPTIIGSRIGAEDAARLAAEPGGRTELIEDYGLDDDQIDDAVAWWRAVNEYEPSAA